MGLWGYPESPNSPAKGGDGETVDRSKSINDCEDLSIVNPYTILSCKEDAKMTEILKFKGFVEDLSKQEIPTIYTASIRSEDGKYRVTMDIHEELKCFDRGDTIELLITTRKPKFKFGRDFVGRGVIYVFRSVGEGKVRIQASIGGLQVTIVCSSKDAPKIPSIPLNVYVKASKV